MTFFKRIYDSLFGKDYGMIWKQFSKENSGIFRFSSRGYRLDFPYRNFSITIETYSYYTTPEETSEYVRGVVEFVSTDPFKVLLTRQGFVENISRIFGAQDIQIGEKRFDKDFMIKSNDEAKTRLLFSNDSIAKIVLNNRTIRLELTDGEGLFGEKPREGNTMLYYILEGEIEEIGQLNALSLLFKTMLDALIEMGVVKSD
ncbi:hypothetical protein [Fluviicola sp.]|uniref:hypothetical protein n=1 Tax=Fluviicola sp. TaxID=1917219 RepID=UPI00262AC00B|nr:hypothetical protein [Fluviicola sp.]